MSLLNEMLHDLAKQKHTQPATPLFIPTLHQNRVKSTKSMVLICFAASALAVYFLLFNKQIDKNYIKKIQSSFESEIPIINKEIISTPVDQQTFVVPEAPALVEPIHLNSYIEPLTSPSALLVPIESPVVTGDIQHKLVDHQVNPILNSINKVYTTQTLEEWHSAQLNKALKAIDTGFDEKAIAILQEILVKIPNASDARENLSSLYLTYGDYAHAADVVNEGLKYSPADMALITIKARLFLDQGKAEEAINILSKHRPSIMSYPDFYGTLAAALQSQGRVIESGSLYQSLIQVDPNDGRYWLGYAIALEHNKKINQAIEAYIRASQNPESEPVVREYAENRLKVLQG